MNLYSTDEIEYEFPLENDFFYIIAYQTSNFYDTFLHSLDSFLTHASKAMERKGEHSNPIQNSWNASN